LNVLAHAWLAGGDEGLRLGGTMGDFVRGTPDPALPERVRAGIRLHRAIDTFTDSHPDVLACRERFNPPYRRYAGIFLDIWFDHYLARDFSRWAGEDLGAWSDALRAMLHRHDALLPEALRGFLAYMDRHGLPAGYADPAVVEQAFQGVSQRLSRANPIATVLPLLMANDTVLRERFEMFFPQLQAFAADWIQANSVQVTRKP
jgi:acyl carrier protein phosphodiesterase